MHSTFRIRIVREATEVTESHAVMKNKIILNISRTVYSNIYLK